MLRSVNLQEKVAIFQEDREGLQSDRMWEERSRGLGSGGNESGGNCQGKKMMILR
jgi:hypothetical protein